MFRFLTFFKSQKANSLEHFFEQMTKEKATWVSISINKNNFGQSLLTKEIDVQSASDVISLKLAETPNGIICKTWKNQTFIREFETISNEKMALNFNPLFDRIIEEELYLFKSALSSFENKSFTPTEILNEDKALEWLRASFKVLTNAVLESLTNPQFLFQTLLFLGVNPKTLNQEIRVIIFNLDIKLEIQPQNRLRVLVYDDKSGELGASKKPVLSGDFHIRHREMLDELITLIATLSPGIKF